MIFFLKQRWMLWAVLAVFIVLKLPHLSYPFWWDESWPYASGVNQMYIHGPSLMPGAISGEVARGHPLMFHFLAACWMKVFGTSNIVMHTFPLFISVVFLAFIYEAGLRLFDRQVAATALILVAFQRIFFMESAFLLLEIMLAFLAFASIYFYTKGKHFLTALSLTLLFYTKESGMVVGLVLGGDALVQLFNKKETLKERWYRIIWLAVPVLCTALFFVLQKSVSGWYVLPMYSSLENSWGGFVNKFKASLDILFIDHHRLYYFLLLGLLSVVVAAKLRKGAYLLLLLPILLLGLFNNHSYDILSWLLLPACIIAVYYCPFKGSFIHSLQWLPAKKDSSIKPYCCAGILHLHCNKPLCNRSLSYTCTCAYPVCQCSAFRCICQCYFKTALHSPAYTCFTGRDIQQPAGSI